MRFCGRQRMHVVKQKRDYRNPIFAVHAGHAPHPWDACTFCATAICSSRVAWYA